MHKGAPRTRRKFRSDWAEMAYLSDKIFYWVNMGRGAVARRFEKRMRDILLRHKRHQGAILVQEGWALVHELNGEWQKAVKRRKREVALLERLQRAAREHDQAAKAYILYECGPERLAESLTFLAIDYAKWGRTGDAKNTLRRAERYCRRARIVFEGKEILEGLEHECHPPDGQRGKRPRKELRGRRPQ